MGMRRFGRLRRRLEEGIGAGQGRAGKQPGSDVDDFVDFDSGSFTLDKKHFCAVLGRFCMRRCFALLLLMLFLPLV